MGKSAQRKTNEAQIDQTQRGLSGARGRLDQAGGNLTNTFAGLETAQSTGQGYEAQQAQAATLGPAGQAQLGNLNASQGYDAVQAQAATTQQRDLRGGNLQNQFDNLQVNTLEADRQAQQTDAALAATLESGALTGASGATALAQAAAQSKQGVASSIGAQEANNQQLRAQGAASTDVANLQQDNQRSQFDVGQQQFNAGQQQQVGLANAAAGNQAAQFGAQAANQFSLASFDAENQLNQFNTSAQNQFAQSRFGAANQFNLANTQATNRAAEFGAGAQNQASANNASAQNQTIQNEASGAQQAQDRQYNHAANAYSQDAAAASAAQQAEADRKAGNKAFWGGIAGAVVGGAASVTTAGISKG